MTIRPDHNALEGDPSPSPGPQPRNYMPGEKKRALLRIKRMILKKLEDHFRKQFCLCS
jgi:hypothetical protein